MQSGAASGIAGIVLASGMSRRFGEGNKLLALIDGSPVVRRTVQAYVEAGVAPVLVVVGHEADLVAAALSELAVHIVYNPDFLQGQSRSLVYGVRALPATSQAAVIGVGDQPLLRSDVIRDLAARFGQGDAPIVAPRYAGRRGNPVLFQNSLFSELLEVVGDQGGRPVIERHHADVAWIDVDDPSIGLDLDTPADFEVLRRDLGP